MKKLNAVLVNNYISKANAEGVRSPMFIYQLSGSAEAIEAFKAAKGEYYQEDEHGRPLYHTKRGFGNTGQIVVSADGKINHDDSQIAMATSVLNQLPAGALRDAVAAKLADQLLAQLGTTAPAPRTVAPAPMEEPADLIEDLPLDEG